MRKMLQIALIRVAETTPKERVFVLIVICTMIAVVQIKVTGTNR